MSNGKSHFQEMIDHNAAAVEYCENRLRDEEDPTIIKTIINQLHERREWLESKKAETDFGTLPNLRQPIKKR